VATLEALKTVGWEVRVLAARTAEEALRAAHEAVGEGAGALVAVGGDGTVHLGLQAVAGTGVPFGVIPAGTGNDFAAETGSPRLPEAAARAVADALAAGRTRRVDLAKVSGPDGYERWYGAVLGAGFDAIVNERANTMRWPRGRMRYDVATYAELIRLRPRRYRVTIDGVTHEMLAVLVAVGNTATYGGGMRICHGADHTDGLLDVVVGRGLSRSTLVRLKAKVREGTHVGHPEILMFRGAHVRIEADGITTYVDGERACRLPVEVTAQPGALLLLA
jgi:diacylglycerol kinase (ATP)